MDNNILAWQVGLFFFVGFSRFSKKGDLSGKYVPRSLRACAVLCVPSQRAREVTLNVHISVVRDQDSACVPIKRVVSLMIHVFTHKARSM